MEGALNPKTVSKKDMTMRKVSPTALLFLLHSGGENRENPERSLPSIFPRPFEVKTVNTRKTQGSEVP